ncbi:hypothetical protein GCM10020367_68550 [Streptomyces sannanensis]|uniref:Uncharacterized protein n=1 Tax=Streptomyces sannanensis TaxID=285536 RepID=A0ABP6S3E5_9ACTN
MKNAGTVAGFPDDESSLAGAGEPSVSVSVFQVLASDGGAAGAGFLAGEELETSSRRVYPSSVLRAAVLPSSERSTRWTLAGAV